jgi:hypothetical protein
MNQLLGDEPIEARHHLLSIFLELLASLMTVIEPLFEF